LLADRAAASDKASDCDAVGGQTADTLITQEQLDSSGFLDETELEAALADKQFCQAPCYSDGHVAAFLLAAGYEPCACYADAQVQAYLEQKGYSPGQGYSDADVGQYLAQEGYLPCECYGDADVQTYLDEHGYSPDVSYSDAQVQAYLDAQGYSPGVGYSDADVALFLEAAGYHPCACYSDSQVQAWLDKKGYVSGPHYVDADVQTYLDKQGYAAGPHYSDADTQSYLEANGYSAGPPYSDADVQAYLEGEGYVSGPHLTLEQCLDAVGGEGYLKPGQAIDSSMLPPEGLDEVSNGVLTTTFKASFASPTAPTPIKDFWPPGVEDQIVVPDVGSIIDVNIQVELLHDAPLELKIQLTAPTGQQFLLHDHGAGIGAGIVTTYDSQTKPVSGDLSALDGQEAGGTWKLLIIDDGWSGGGDSGTLQSWSVKLESLSDHTVAVKGDLKVEGNLTLTGGGDLLARTNLPLVPAGMIAMFEAECPTGWTEVTGLRTRFPRGWGGSMPLKTGGAATAPHSHSVPYACGSGDCIDWAGGYSGSFAAPGSSGTDAPPIIPPYAEVVFCKKD
jgi:subtilisin-like proprotein convertase family protein/ribulose bisphosphate carboxylase small subunit